MVKPSPDTKPLNTNHREQVLASRRCGCYYCLAIFPTTEVTRWIPERHPKGNRLRRGRTALCPRCGIDSIIPDNDPTPPVTPALLTALHARWFGVMVSRGRK